MDEITAHFARYHRRSYAVLVAVLAGLLAGGLAPRSAAAQPDTTRWTPELAMQYDQIADTEISPGGTAYLTVDLSPGRYAWVSHASKEKGMMKTFTVE
jgi:hypothetical protein